MVGHRHGLVDRLSVGAAQLFIGKLDHDAGEILHRHAPVFVEKEAEIIHVRRDDIAILLADKRHKELLLLMDAGQRSRHAENRIDTETFLARDARLLQNHG